MDRYAEFTRQELVLLVKDQHELIEQLAKQNEQLTTRIGQLTDEVARLKSGGRSGGAAPTTGSGGAVRNPPPFVKPNRAPREKKPRKKRERGFSRRREEADREVHHYPESCSNCGRRLSGDGWEHRRRQVVDIPPMWAVVVDHVIRGRHCGVCNVHEIASPDLSSEVLGKARLGVRVMSLVSYLSTACRMTVRTIQEFLKSFFRLRISIGEIAEILHRVASHGKPTYAAIRDEVLASGAVHADETGYREDGVNGYVWVICSATARYFVRNGSRGGAVIQEMLGDYDGALITDFYGAYNRHRGDHQFCWAHVFTDLRALRRAHPDIKSLERWDADIHKIYEDAKGYAHVNPLQRRRQRGVYAKRLRTLCRPCSGGGLPHSVLAKRLLDKAHGMFVFVERPEVDATNNAAERAIRPCVVKRKVSGGTRSPRGSDTRATHLSLFETWKLKSRSGFDACLQMLSSNPCRAPG